MDAETIIRDLDVSNKALAEERDKLREQLYANESRMAAGDGALIKANSRVETFARLALNIRIVLARREGYIDRVRESDEAGAPGPVQNPAPGELLEDLQNAMSTADDASFDRMVSAMSPETLNKILGRDNADDPDVLR